jgi:hypothetical protein
MEHPLAIYVFSTDKNEIDESKLDRSGVYLPISQEKSLLSDSLGSYKLGRRHHQ